MHVLGAPGERNPEMRSIRDILGRSMAATLGRVPEGASDGKVRSSGRTLWAIQGHGVRGQARGAEKSETLVPPYAGKDVSSWNPLAQTGRKCSDVADGDPGPNTSKTKSPSGAVSTCDTVALESTKHCVLL